MEKEFQKKCEELECPEVDDYNGSTPGVLLSHQIKHFATKHCMIIPFNPKKLKPAGYYLSVGKDYAINGELKKLSEEPGKDELIIDPFQVAIISTEETINLPRFIIARWNLRVTYCYKGLLWTGALQVDPGWCGQLFCPIYNLSSEKVVIKLGDPIALMDFVKTTPFKKGESEEYGRPPKRKTLGDYNWKLKSALFTEAAQRIDKIEKEVEQRSDKIERELERRTDKIEDRVRRAESFIGLIFTSIAVLFTALSILIASRREFSYESLPRAFYFWTSVSMSLSVVAIALALFLRKRLEFEKKWQKIAMIIFYVFCSILFVVLVFTLTVKIISWSNVIQWLKLQIG